MIPITSFGKWQPHCLGDGTLMLVKEKLWGENFDVFPVEYVKNRKAFWMEVDALWKQKVRLQRTRMASGNYFHMETMSVGHTKGW